MFLTTIGWIMGNFFIELIRLFNKNRILQIKYEDLCNNPEKELKRIGKFLNCEIESVIKKVKTQKEITVGHNIAGNGIRMNNSIIFKPKSRAKKLPFRYKLLFKLIAWPLLLYYGYKIRSH